MFFSSGFFGSLLTGSGKWNANLAAKAFEFLPAGGKKKAIPYESIYGVRSNPGVMWSEVTIESSKGSVTFDGIGNSQASLLTGLLRNRVADDLLAAIEPHRKPIANLSRSFKMLFGKEQYLSNYDITAWASNQESKIGEPARAVLAAVRNPLFPSSRLEGNLQNQIELLVDVLQGKSSIVAERNEKFVDAEMSAHKVFFDSVEKTPLTNEQRRAAIVMEDRNLLIAAAGSGKTSSVVGKVGYALLRGYATPDHTRRLPLATNIFSQWSGSARSMPKRVRMFSRPIFRSSFQEHCSRNSRPN